MPAFQKIRELGMYHSLVSMPHAYWMNWTSIAQTSMWHTEQGEWRSCYTHILVGILENAVIALLKYVGNHLTAAWSATSSLVSEVLARTHFTSPKWPCMMSYLGDSGMTRTSKASTTEGIDPAISMTHHPRSRRRLKKWSKILRKNVPMLMNT